MDNLDSIEEQIKNLQQNIIPEMEAESEKVSQSLSDILQKVENLRDTIVRGGKKIASSGSTKLSGKLRGWFSGITRAEARPTTHQLEYFQKLKTDNQKAIQKVNDIIKQEVPSLNQILKQYNLPIVIVKNSK